MTEDESGKQLNDSFRTCTSPQLWQQLRLNRLRTQPIYELAVTSQRGGSLILKKYFLFSNTLTVAICVSITVFCKTKEKFLKFRQSTIAILQVFPLNGVKHMSRNSCLRYVCLCVFMFVVKKGWLALAPLERGYVQPTSPRCNNGEERAGPRLQRISRCVGMAIFKAITPTTNC